MSIEVCYQFQTSGLLHGVCEICRLKACSMVKLQLFEVKALDVYGSLVSIT